MTYRTTKIYPSYADDTTESIDSEDELFTTEIFDVICKQTILNKYEQQTNEHTAQVNTKYKLSKDIMNITQCGDSFRNLTDFDIMVVFEHIPRRDLYKIFNNVNKSDLQTLNYKNKTLFDILQRAHLRKLRLSLHGDYEEITNKKCCCCI